MKKPKIGYKKTKKIKIKNSSYLSKLILPGKKKISIIERIIKFLIYIALRLVTKPSTWKNHEKNYEMIDNIYRKLTGSDMVFIPSSIAYYIIIAFMPIISLLVLIIQIPVIHDVFDVVRLKSVFLKFIPGIDKLIDTITDSLNQQSTAKHIGGLSGGIIFFLISTWIASGGCAKLIYTQSFIFEHKLIGGWWMNKFKGIMIVILLTIFILFILLINIIVEKYIYQINMPLILKNILIYFLFFIILFIWNFLGAALLFKFSPRFKIKFWHVIPGAVVTALPITLFLFFFSILSYLLSYSVYGTIAIIMYIGLLSLWLSNFLFIGIITNASYYKIHISKYTRKKWTISRK